MYNVLKRMRQFKEQVWPNPIDVSQKNIYQKLTADDESQVTSISFLVAPWGVFQNQIPIIARFGTLI